MLRKPLKFNKIGKSGIILIDILLAFSLSILFIFLMTESSISSRQIFEKAKKRSFLLDAYDSGDGDAKTRLYGNERIFENIYVASLYSTSSLWSSTSSSSPYLASSSVLSFVKVFQKPSLNLDDAPGTPLCSIDFAGRTDKEVFGSYSYFQKQVEEEKSSNASGDLRVSMIPITLPVDPLLPLTDLEIRNDIAYISADSSIASDPDLLIVDIHDPTSPKIISNINTGPGLSAIALAGKRIYAAAPSTVGQLHIIRLDGLASPILEYRYKLPLPYATATPALASSIFYKKSRIFLGTEKWVGQELNIIDVSNPLSPSKLGGIEIGSKINDIFVNGDIAYVADSDQDQLRLFDIHDPSAPILINKFSPSGWQRQEGKVLSYFEDNLDFGRTSGGFNFTSDHELFDWLISSPISILAGNLTDSISADIPGGIYGIIRDQKHIFLATRQVDKEFQIFDPDFSSASASSSSYSLPITPQVMTCDGNSIYILAHTAPVIYRVEIKYP